MDSTANTTTNALGLASFWVCMAAIGVIAALMTLAFVAAASGQSYNGPLVAGLGLGMIAAMLAWFVAIGLGIAAVCQKGKPKTMGILGISLSGGLIFIMLILIVAGSARGSYY